MSERSFWEFTTKEQGVAASLVAKGKAEEQRNDRFAVMNFDDFYSLFTDQEVVIMKKWLSINPKQVDYKLPFIGVDNVVPSLVPIRGQQVTVDGTLHVLPTAYLPEKVSTAYKVMNDAAISEIGKPILVNHGYRSPARQVMLFFEILVDEYHFDFEKTLARVCLPDYSEHVCTKRQAIDFVQSVITGNEQEFEETREYAWLKTNAANFGFHESYPKDNSVGMMFEPWHWHFEKA